MVNAPASRPNTKRSQSTGKTILVAVLVALACGTLVSLLSVQLEPRQTANRQRAARDTLTTILANQPGIETALAGVQRDRIRSYVVELDRGCFDHAADPASFDLDRALTDRRLGKPLTAPHDIASISFRPKQMLVHFVRDSEQTLLIVLPVYGTGYASKLKGYLSLHGDGSTVESLHFFEHGETPGIGARIANPEWSSAWRNKLAYDSEGAVRLGVATRASTSRADSALYEIDAMTGATKTGEGVTNLLRFWLGEQGYGPLLRNLAGSVSCVQFTR